MSYKSFRQIVHVKGIKVKRSIFLSSYKWYEVLDEIKYKNNGILDLTNASLYFMDFTLSNNHTLTEYLGILSPGIKVLLFLNILKLH